MLPFAFLVRRTTGEQCCTAKGTEDGDLSALEAVKKHRIELCAMVWAAAQRAGVRDLLTEDLHDRFKLEGVRFANPFEPAHDRLVDEIPP
jgi:predicted nucleic acid-binding protein